MMGVYRSVYRAFFRGDVLRSMMLEGQRFVNQYAHDQVQ